MSWKVRFSRSAVKFFKKEERLTEEAVLEFIVRAVNYFKGEEANLDIKKLLGRWQGFYRIRKGKIRIIAEFDFENSVIFIEEIDWRGNVYK